jgi:hypothetical protein
MPSNQSTAELMRQLAEESKTDADEITNELIDIAMSLKHRSDSTTSRRDLMEKTLNQFLINKDKT